MQNLQDLSELPRHDFLEVAKVLPQLQVDPSVGLAQLEDTVSNPHVHLMAGLVVLLRVILEMRERLIVVLHGPIQDDASPRRVDY